MRRRLGRGRGRKQSGSGDGGGAPIDAARAFERIRESGVVPAEALEPVSDPGVPESFAALATGTKGDDTRLAVGFAPANGGDALLATLALAQRLAEEEEFRGEAIAVAPQWSIAARRRLMLVGGGQPYEFRAVVASALADGDSTVELEPQAEPPLTPAAQVAAALDDPAERDLFGRALAAFEGLAAKHGGSVRGFGESVELCLMARCVAALRVENGGLVLAMLAPDRSTAKLNSAGLATAMDRLEGALRKRLGDRRVKGSEEGLRAQLVTELVSAAGLRRAWLWPLGGADAEVLDVAGIGEGGRLAVGAVRGTLGLPELGAVLDAALAVAGGLPRLLGEAGGVGPPQLLLAAREFDPAVLRVLATLTLESAVFDVSSGRQPGLDRRETGAPAPVRQRATRSRGGRRGQGRRPTADTEGAGESSEGESQARRFDEVSLFDLDDDRSAPGTSAEGEGARRRRRGRGRRRGRRGGNGRSEGRSEEGGGDTEARPEARSEEGGEPEREASRGNDREEERDRGQGTERGAERGRGRGRDRGRGRGRDRGRAPDPVLDRDQDLEPEAGLAEDIDDLEETLAPLAPEVPDVPDDSEIAAGLVPRFPVLNGEGEPGEDDDEAVEPDEAVEEEAIAVAAPPEGKATAAAAPEAEAPPRPPRRRAVFVAHADRDSVAAALLLARDHRLVDAFWVYPQDDLMTFFRSVAVDLREGTPIFVVGFRASPFHDALQAASLYADRLIWYDHHEWPPEDVESLRQTIGSENVHVFPGTGSSLPAVLHMRTRRSRFSDKLVDLVTGRFSDHDFERWGHLWFQRLGELAQERGDVRARIQPLLAGRPSDLAREAAAAETPPEPEEVSYISHRDFRLVHFGGQTLVVVSTPPEIDPHLAARVARERYDAALSLSVVEGSDLLVLGTDEVRGRRSLDVAAMVTHLVAKHGWIEALPNADRVARMRVRDVVGNDERLDDVIREIAMGRSVLEG